MRKPPFARAVSGLGRPPERARHCSRRIRHDLAPGAAWDTPQHRLDPARGRQHPAETPSRSLSASDSRCSIVTGIDWSFHSRLSVSRAGKGRRGAQALLAWWHLRQCDSIAYQVGWNQRSEQIAAQGYREPPWLKRRHVLRLRSDARRRDGRHRGRWVGRFKRWPDVPTSPMDHQVRRPRVGRVGHGVRTSRPRVP